MAVWKRLQRLPMSDDEKGRILSQLSQEELERAMPADITDAVLATGLRYRYIRQPPAPRARDHDEDEVVALAASVPEFSLEDQSKEALKRYLHDFKCLEGLVPVASEIMPERAPPAGYGLQRSPFVYSLSDLGAAVRKALQPPRPGSGKIVANSRMLEFLDILHWLNASSSVSRTRLDYHLSMDKVETEETRSTPRCRKRKRPDFLLEVPDFLLLLGEGKDDERQMGVAIQEIGNKLNNVPDWVYGNVNFMLAFALAGFNTRLFVKRASERELESLDATFNLTSEAHRVELVLIMIKLYFLCLSICKRVVSTGMMPLFKRHARGYSTIELDGEGCAKTIPDWSKYKDVFGVSFASVQRAYQVAKIDQLVYAVEMPRVTKDKYKVRTGPLGLPAEKTVKDEDDCKSLAKDVLTALAALHDESLVHRDVRLSNVIWWPVQKCYVLIDLETVAPDGRKMNKQFTNYTPSTLVDGKYVTSSDLHQLGVLLERSMRLDLQEPATRAFVNALKSHQTTAKALLTHAWLRTDMIIRHQGLQQP